MYMLSGLVMIGVSLWLISVKYNEAYAELITDKGEGRNFQRD